MGSSNAPVAYESAVGAEVVIDGRRYVNFGGSSYLGLASNQHILEAGIQALRTYGSGGPIPITHRVATRPLQDVELEACRFFGSEASFYLAAGYHFGLTALSVLREQYQVIFFDELSHYALRDGIAACGLASYPFHHRDPEDLSTQLRKHLFPGARPLVVTDGLYSTFGDIAPLAELLEQVAPYDGRLVIDESHGFGVLGAEGKGAVEHCGVNVAMTYVGGSMGKAFGTCGGIILTTNQQLPAICSSRVALGASMGLPACAAMCARSLRYVREHPELLQRLRANTRRLKSGLKDIGVNVGGSIVPIAAFATGTIPAESVKSRLMEEGIYVYRSNYIGARREVIRLGIFADHTNDHIDCLLHALRRVL